MPYLNKDKELKYGILACELEYENDTAAPPRAHPMWWQGEYPCDIHSSPIDAIQNPSAGKTLLTGFDVNYCFSARPSVPGERLTPTIVTFTKKLRPILASFPRRRCVFTPMRYLRLSGYLLMKVTIVFFFTQIRIHPARRSTRYQIS